MEKRDRVGDGDPDVPTAARRQFGMSRKMLRMIRWVVEDADPYNDFLTCRKWGCLIKDKLNKMLSLRTSDRRHWCGNPLDRRENSENPGDSHASVRTGSE